MRLEGSNPWGTFVGCASGLLFALPVAFIAASVAGATSIEVARLIHGKIDGKIVDRSIQRATAAFVSTELAGMALGAIIGTALYPQSESSLGEHSWQAHQPGA